MTTPLTIPAFKARLEVHDKQLGIACSLCGAWSPGLLVAGVQHVTGCTLVGESSADRLAQDEKERATPAKPTKRTQRVPRVRRSA